MLLKLFIYFLRADIHLQMVPPWFIIYPLVTLLEGYFDYLYLKLGHIHVIYANMKKITNSKKSKLDILFTWENNRSSIYKVKRIKIRGIL